MTTIYFGIKVLEGLIGVVFLIVLAWTCIKFIKNTKIARYLESVGYERVLLNTAAFGDNHTYGYRKKDDDGYFIIISDSELKGLSLKQIKQKCT